MQIRPIRAADVLPCRHIIAQNFDDDVAARFVLEVGDVWSDCDNPPLYFVAVTRYNVVVGFGGMQRSRMMHGLWNFTWLNVHRAHHDEGIGAALVRHRLEEITRLGDSLVHLMSRQEGFFARFGFRSIRDYDGWHLMELKLGEVGL